MKSIGLSVVVPFFNENRNLEKFHRELTSVLIKIPIGSEIIYVDDGSTDESVATLKSLFRSSKKTKIETKLILLRRNFGQTAATSAGIDQSKGELVSFMDADLQNDPEDLLKFFHEINKGFDAVFGWRKCREDYFLRNFVSKVANFIIRKIFNIPLHDVGCSLKIIKRELLNDVHLYGESHRIMPALVYWKGVKIKELTVSHRKRIYEKSKYGYSRILKLVIDLITIKFLNSYGTKPAYVFGTLGICSNLLGVVALILTLYKKIFLGVYVHKNPLFLIAIFFILLGVQFILMGLLAELLVRIYFESQRKTTYEIKDARLY
ncbi:glycosyltransferase [Candidatus Daviesbacteria bacterium]|nr:glycosyltransferase [Candidatus Daviesbacteria bacterium]